MIMRSMTYRDMTINRTLRHNGDIFIGNVSAGSALQHFPHVFSLLPKEVSLLRFLYVYYMTTNLLSADKELLVVTYIHIKKRYKAFFIYYNYYCKRSLL